MPGFFTHYLFGWEALSTLPVTALTDPIHAHAQVYSLGLQGPDLFSYHPWLLAHKKRNLADACHTKNTGAFFSALTEAACSLSEADDRTIAFIYLLGFIGHYTLDSQCHPFVYAKAGPIRPITRSFGIHLKLEADFDRILLSELRGKTRAAVRQDRLILPSKHERRVITKILYRAVTRTYPDMTVSPASIAHSIAWMGWFCRFLRDPKGYKRRLVKAADRLIFHCDVLSPLVADRTAYFEDPMNRNHQPWHNYWHPEQVSTESVDDLIAKASVRFAAFYGLLSSVYEAALPDPASLLHRIGNCSYHSGEELQKDK